MMRNKWLMVGVALLLCTVSAVSIWQSVRPPRPTTVNPAPSHGLGEALARQAGQLLGGRGQVVVWTYESTPQTCDIVDPALAGLEGALKSQPGLTLQAVERIAAPEFPPFPGVDIVTSFTAEKFVELLTKYATADAVVSFVAPPALTREQIAALPQPRPKLIVVPLFTQLPENLLPAGVVQVAIIGRSDYIPQPDDPTPQTTEEWFARYYRVVTATDPSVTRLP